MKKDIIKIASPFVAIFILCGIGGLKRFCINLAKVLKSLLPFVGNLVTDNIWTSPMLWGCAVLFAGSIFGVIKTEGARRVALIIGSIISLLLTLATFGMTK